MLPAPGPRIVARRRRWTTIGLLAAVLAGSLAVASPPAVAQDLPPSRWDEVDVIVTAPPKPWRPGRLVFEVRVEGPADLGPDHLRGTIGSGFGAQPIELGETIRYPIDVEIGTVTPRFPFWSASGRYKVIELPTTNVGWDTDEEHYVHEAYRRLFDRAPDPSGRTYWANRLRAGLSRDRFALSMVATTEYRRTLVWRYGLADRDAGVEAAQPIVDRLAGATLREILVQHWASNGKVATCVDRIPPETEAPGSFGCWAKWIYTTFTGAATSADRAQAASFGNTVRGRTFVATYLVYGDRALRPAVDGAYRAYLGRAADPSGLDYWVRRIRAGMREEGVEARLLGSTEFFRSTLRPPADR